MKVSLRNKKQISLAVILSVISLVFCVYYFSFFLFYRFFRFPPDINKSLLNSWVWQVIGSKGIEIYILFFGTLSFLIASYFAIIYSKLIPFISNKIVQIILISVLILKVITTYPKKIIGVTPSIPVNIFLISIVLAIIYLGFKYNRRFLKLGKNIKSSYLIIFWLLFAVITILSIQKVSYTDYNFFIGPGLKLSYGERLGSFYMQYGLSETYLFKFMIELGLKLHHMQLILALILTFFFILYQKVSLNLIKDRVLLFLFMFTLILLRFLALEFPAISSPQANPMRLDLWLPLFFMVYKFGFYSILTSAAFSLGYIADDFFGLMFLGVYIIAVTILSLKSWLDKNTVHWRKGFLIVLPIALALSIHFYFFGTITSQSAKLVNDLMYWQMVISPYSMFWPYICVLPLFLYLSLKGKDKFRRSLDIFLLGLALVELIYFYGRSHEHNLLTTSGILVLILYLTFDKLRVEFKLKNSLYLISSTLLVIITFSFSQYIILNFTTAFNHISRKKILESNQIDKDIEKNMDFFKNYQTDKIFIMSFADAYINYRYKLKQTGYYSPFVANLYKEDTINLLRSLAGKGYILLYEEGDWFNVEEYNDFLKNKGVKFQSSKSKTLGNLQFNELKIIEK